MTSGNPERTDCCRMDVACLDTENAFMAESSPSTHKAEDCDRPQCHSLPLKHIFLDNKPVRRSSAFKPRTSVRGKVLLGVRHGFV